MFLWNPFVGRLGEATGNQPSWGPAKHLGTSPCLRSLVFIMVGSRLICNTAENFWSSSLLAGNDGYCSVGLLPEFNMSRPSRGVYKLCVCG